MAFSSVVPIGAVTRVLLGHDLGDLEVEPGLEPQIAVGQDADELVPLGHGHAGDAVLLHDIQGVGDLGVGRDGDGIDDHAALGFLDLVHFLGLHVDGQRLVDEPEPALLGQGDGQLCLGHRVHGRAHERDIEDDLLGQLRPDIDVLGQDIGFCGQQQHIVKRETFSNRTDNHGISPYE